MTPPPFCTFAKSVQPVSHLADHPRKPEKGLSGTYFVVLNREEDKATLRFFEKRLVLLVEFDVADETLAGVIDILFLSSNDQTGGLDRLLSDVEGLRVEAEGVNSVCHRGGSLLEEGGRSDGNRHGCYGF